MRNNFVSPGRKYVLRRSVKHSENEGKSVSQCLLVLYQLECPGWISHPSIATLFFIWLIWLYIYDSFRWRLAHLSSVCLSDKWELNPCKIAPVVWNATKLRSGLNYYFDKKCLSYSWAKAGSAVISFAKNF